MNPYVLLALVIGLPVAAGSTVETADRFPVDGEAERVAETS